MQVHIDQISIMNFEDAFLQTCVTFELDVCESCGNKFNDLHA